MLKEGDFILIIDRHDWHYLQIGKVVRVEFYDGCNDVKEYCVEFADEDVVEYDYKLVTDYLCKVLMFERR